MNAAETVATLRAHMTSIVRVAAMSERPEWHEMNHFLGTCDNCECRPERLLADCAELGGICQVCFEDVMDEHFPKDEDELT
jgi:hypothetical protein